MSPETKEILIEVIKILPNCFLPILFLLLLFIFRGRIRDLFDRLTKVGAFGVQVEFGEAKEQLKRALKAYPASDLTEKQVEKLVNRAERLRDLLRGSRILWIDDYPTANAAIHRFLNEYGVVIDKATTTDEAIMALRWSSPAFEVVISDMARQGNGVAGLELLEKIRELPKPREIILFVANLDEGKPTPQGARLITNKVDRLINEIFNMIEEADDGRR